MSAHLSPDQVSQWIAGERPDALHRHLAECAECRSEVQHLDTAFELFRESGERWSEHWYQASPAPRPLRSLWPRLAVAGGLVAALLVGAVWIRQPLPAVAETPFVEIPYVAPLAPYERTSVVRMEVPVEALIASGFEIHGQSPGSTVAADVLVGQDGRAHAIRLLSSSNGSIKQ